MLARIAMIFCLFLVPAMAMAESMPLPPRHWNIIPSESSISFTAKQWGKEFTGTFKSFNADIAFDVGFDTSKVTATIDPASAETGDKERDSNIVSAEWFDPKKFPEARFETTSIRKKDDGSFEAVGNLTIKNIVLPVSLPFTLAFSKDESGKERAIMDGSVTIDRSKFDLGTGDWADPSIIANNVTVKIRISALAESR